MHRTADAVSQRVYPVDRTRKRELLSWLIGSENWLQVLVFTRTKHAANRLATQLEKDGLNASAIHGNKSQGARSRALREFKNGQTRVLVATDIAARGLDIDQLPHVVNFEMPQVAEDYVHRVGRTGRAGNAGEAVSLVCAEEIPLLAAVERLLKRTIPRTVVAGFEAGAPATAGMERRAQAGEKQNGQGKQRTTTGTAAAGGHKRSNQPGWNKRRKRAGPAACNESSRRAAKSRGRSGNSRKPRASA
jgi:ATP-dependent RNA helicase RhlE